MEKRLRRSVAGWVAWVPGFCLLLAFAMPAAAADAPALDYQRGGLHLERDKAFPAQADPGKFRREIYLTGDDGGVYIMVWDLIRLHPAEWLERALGPVTGGDRTWARAWIPGALFAAVVEVPKTTGSRAMRVYAVRFGDVGIAALCYGVETQTLSEACDLVTGSMEVRP